MAVPVHRHRPRQIVPVCRRSRPRRLSGCLGKERSREGEKDPQRPRKRRIEKRSKLKGFDWFDDVVGNLINKFMRMRPLLRFALVFM